jgi:hypothetical protein
MDDYFYEMLRESMVRAGATDAEIDSMAAWIVACIVKSTEAGSVERHEQFDLIVEHFCCTSMRIALGNAGGVVRVEFPERPRTH